MIIFLFLTVYRISCIQYCKLINLGKLCFLHDRLCKDFFDYANHGLSNTTTLISCFLQTHSKAESPFEHTITIFTFFPSYCFSNMSLPAITCPIAVLLRFCFTSITSTFLPLNNFPKKSLLKELKLFHKILIVIRKCSILNPKL